MNGNKEHWTRQVFNGLVLLLTIAIGARVVYYGLLVPLSCMVRNRYVAI